MIKEILSNIRGEKSQMQVSRQLGFSYNQVYRWEGGFAKISWVDFIRFCGACKAPIGSALAVGLEFRGKITSSSEFVHFLMGSQDQKTFCRAFKVSKSTLRKWLRGESSPSLNWVLNYLESKDQILIFISKLAKIERIKSLRSAHAKRMKLLDFVLNHPVTLAIPFCLWMDQYERSPEHDSNFVASCLGISVGEEKELFEALEKLGFIERVGKKYSQKQPSHFTPRADFESVTKAREYWIRRGLECLRGQNRDDTRSETKIILLALNEQSESKILKLCRDFIEKIVQVGSTSSDTLDRVRVLNLQMFDPKTR